MANIEKRDKGIKDLLTGDAFKAQVQNALPTHLKPDRFIRIALTALTKTPKLMECSQESFFQALLDLSQLGLEPDGRRAHLIPYGKTVKLIVDYKGLVELAMQTGNVSNIHADLVCENDVFEYDRGEIKTHKIDFKKPRGNAYAAYAICRFKDGTEKTEVMTRDDVESIRKRSQAGTSGPWVTDWNEMAKKTAFRRLSKWIPLSPEQRDALEKDGDRFEPINVKYVEHEPDRGVKALEGKLADKPEDKTEDPQAPKDGTEPFDDPPKKPESAGAEDNENQITGIVKAVNEKEKDCRDGKKRVSYGIKIEKPDGEAVWMNTFSDTLFKFAKSHKGKQVQAYVEQTQFGLDVKDMGEEQE